MSAPAEVWELLPKTFSPEIWVVRVDRTSDEPAIASVIDRRHARLIAAAPDLLAALASIETKARELADDSMQSNRGLWLACADEARAAIAKATGGAP